MSVFYGPTKTADDQKYFNSHISKDHHWLPQTANIIPPTLFIIDLLVRYRFAPKIIGR